MVQMFCKYSVSQSTNALAVTTYIWENPSYLSYAKCVSAFLLLSVKKGRTDSGCYSHWAVARRAGNSVKEDISQTWDIFLF